MPVQTDGPEDYKAKYKTLKRKLKLLIYENECFQEELRKAQRALLRVRRDKSFLLDRLLQYQRGPDSSTDSEQTEESDTEVEAKGDQKSCRKRLAMEGQGPATSASSSTSSSTQNPPPSSSTSSKPPSKKKKSSSSSGGGGSKSNKQSGGKLVTGGSVVLGGGVVGGQGSNPLSSAANPQAATTAATAAAAAAMRKIVASHLSSGGLHAQAAGAGSQGATAAATMAALAAGRRVTIGAGGVGSIVTGVGGHHGAIVGMGGHGHSVVGVAGHHSDGQLSREEVERRLAARQPLSDFTTTAVSLTLPNQLFSDNIMEGDFMEEEVETSPSNVDDDVTVDNYD